MSSTDELAVTLAAFSFRSHLPEGPKNLRQLSHFFEIIVSPRDESTAPMIFHLRFKVYADSTIRRGKKSLRRDCFIFDLHNQTKLHVRGSPEPVGKSSLKWASEKKEQFLAFEAEVEFFIQVFSTDLSKNWSATIQPSMSAISNEAILKWTDEAVQEVQELSPRNSLSSPRTFPVGSTTKRTLSEHIGWILSPTCWNWTVNPVESIAVTIVSLEKPFPAAPPTVVLVFGPGHRLEIVPDSFDWSKRSSLVFRLPRCLPKATCLNAIKSGTRVSKVVELCIIDEQTRKLWHSDFLFECSCPPNPRSSILSQISGRASSFQVCVCSSSSGVIGSFEATLKDLVIHLKRLIQDHDDFRIPQSRQRLVYGEFVLEDRKSLECYGVMSGDTMLLFETLGEFFIRKKFLSCIGLFGSVYQVSSNHNPSVDFFLRRFESSVSKAQRNQALLLTQKIEEILAGQVLKYQHCIFDELDSSLPAGLLFEFCDQDLSSWIAERAKHQQFLSLSEVLSVSIPILSVFARIHSSGFFHADLNPSLVFITRNLGCLEIKLAGFALCFKSGADEEKQALDIYNCAQIMFKLLTLDLEFHSQKDMLSILSSLAQFQEPRFINLIKGMLDPIRSARPSAAACLEELNLIASRT
jgi:hypothetical protein